MDHAKDRCIVLNNTHKDKECVNFLIQALSDEVLAWLSLE